MTANPLQELYQEEIYQIPSPVVIFLPQAWHEVPEDDKTLLFKILGSVRLSPGSVVIRHMDQVSAETLAMTGSKKVLMFGSRGPSDKSYEVVNVNGISLLQGDALRELDDVKKKTLWAGLKQMFSA